MSGDANGLSSIMDSVTNIASSSGDQWAQFNQYLADQRQQEFVNALARNQDRRAAEMHALEMMLAQQQTRQGMQDENWRRDFRKGLARGQTVPNQLQLAGR